MAKNPGNRRRRYEVSAKVQAPDDHRAEAVPENMLDITDPATLRIAEEKALARAYRDLLKEARTDTPVTCDLLRRIHACIFGDIYEWAGRWRIVWFGEPTTTSPVPDFLEERMRTFEREVLAKYPPSVLRSDDLFCAAVGRIHAEFLVIHPFREGNSRTIKLATDLLAAQTGQPLLVYDHSEQGRKEYRDAAKAAYKENYMPMIEITRWALGEARNRR